LAAKETKFGVDWNISSLRADYIVFFVADGGPWMNDTGQPQPLLRTKNAGQCNVAAKTSSRDEGKLLTGGKHVTAVSPDILAQCGSLILTHCGTEGKAGGS
jgi:hypothetical protein